MIRDRKNAASSMKESMEVAQNKTSQIITSEENAMIRRTDVELEDVEVSALGG